MDNRSPLPAPSDTSPRGVSDTSPRGVSDTSPTPGGGTGRSSPDDASPEAPGDVSPTTSSATAQVCQWCGASLVDGRRKDAIYCSRKCRQSAFRLRRRRSTLATGPGAGPGLVFGYADPPYIGTAAKYYADQPNYAGEVDHAELIASLRAAQFAGWALSCSARSLRELLPMCPEEARVCAWVKPIGVPRATYGPHNAWEPVIVVGGRKRRPGTRDWLRAQPARGGGTLPGRKPIAFCAFLFDMLGMVPGDQLVDLFPGTGIVTRAWGELSARTSATRRCSSSDVSPLQERQASLIEERHG